MNNLWIIHDNHHNDHSHHSHIQSPYDGRPVLRAWTGDEPLHRESSWQSSNGSIGIHGGRNPQNSWIIWPYLTSTFSCLASWCICLYLLMYQLMYQLIYLLHPDFRWFPWSFHHRNTLVEPVDTDRWIWCSPKCERGVLGAVWRRCPALNNGGMPWESGQ